MFLYSIYYLFIYLALGLETVALSLSNPVLFVTICNNGVPR